jgi:hypothetical protein
MPLAGLGVHIPTKPQYFQEVEFPDLIFAHLARAALLALALRSSGVIFAALAIPPFLPPLLPIALMNLRISVRVNVLGSDWACPVERSIIARAASFTS